MKSYYIDNRPMTEEEKHKYFESSYDFSRELREDVIEKINETYNEKL